MSRPNNEVWEQELVRLAARDHYELQRAEERASKRRPLAELGKELGAFLEEDDKPLQWRVEGLHVVGNNTTVTAGYKTGKSTLMLNLVRSLADGADFLGRPVTKPAGRVAYWNLEVGSHQMRHWWRDVNTVARDRIYVANLRGQVVPLYENAYLDEVVQTMQEQEIEVWVVDPAARLLPGWPGGRSTENDNTIIGDLCGRLDRIKEQAGISCLWVPIHTGRSDDGRARGAAMWDDWADVRWIMKKRKRDGEDLRTFEADGRDVDVAEVGLDMDKRTRRLRAIDLDGLQDENDAKAVVHALFKQDGLDGRELEAAIKGVDNKRKKAAVDRAERSGWIVRTTEGRKKVARLNSQHPEVQDLRFNNPDTETL